MSFYLLHKEDLDRIDLIEEYLGIVNQLDSMASVKLTNNDNVLKDTLLNNTIAGSLNNISNTDAVSQKSKKKRKRFRFFKKKNKKSVEKQDDNNNNMVGPVTEVTVELDVDAIQQHYDELKEQDNTSQTKSTLTRDRILSMQLADHELIGLTTEELEHIRNNILDGFQADTLLNVANEILERLYEIQFGDKKKKEQYPTIDADTYTNYRLLIDDMETKINTANASRQQYSHIVATNDNDAEWIRRDNARIYSQHKVACLRLEQSEVAMLRATTELAELFDYEIREAALHADETYGWMTLLEVQISQEQRLNAALNDICERYTNPSIDESDELEQNEYIANEPEYRETPEIIIETIPIPDLEFQQLDELLKEPVIEPEPEPVIEPEPEPVTTTSDRPMSPAARSHSTGLMGRTELERHARDDLPKTSTVPESKKTAAFSKLFRTKEKKSKKKSKKKNINDEQDQTQADDVHSASVNDENVVNLLEQMRRQRRSSKKNPPTTPQLHLRRQNRNTNTNVQPKKPVSPNVNNRSQSTGFENLTAAQRRKILRYTPDSKIRNMEESQSSSQLNESTLRLHSPAPERTEDSSDDDEYEIASVYTVQQ